MPSASKRALLFAASLVAGSAAGACDGEPSGTAGSAGALASGSAGSAASAGSGGSAGAAGSGASAGAAGSPSACDPVECGGVCDGDVCTRTIGCSPAPVGLPGDIGSLQDPAFLAGLVDLEFDPDCTAWGATLISGTDYLRSISPDGMATSYPGVTNLNMGEVSVLQDFTVPRSGHQAGANPPPPPDLEVALSYICCSACGCQLDSTPQGVSRFDPLTSMLPLVIASMTFTDGSGPFGSGVIDTGPAGLSYGTDRVLYVGNVDVNGDYYRLDLATSKKELFTTFASRVYASAPFDDLSMLVALEGGEIRLLSLADATSSVFATSDQPVTGMIRDFFDGSVYVARRDSQIWKYAADGSGALAWTAKGSPRLSIAPDGYLYAIEIPAKIADATAEIERWQLPLTK